MAHPGARNPKTRTFSMSVAEGINTRVEQLADAAGMNKTTMAAMCLSAGLNMLERVYLIGVEQYAEQAAKDKLDIFSADLDAVKSG